MADKTLVIAGSGGGKSTSLRNLDPKSTAVIRVVKKPLPFRGWKKGYTLYDKTTKKGNLFDATKWEFVLLIMDTINVNMPEIKTLVIDDAQYIMSMEYMDRAKERGFDKFTEMADHFLKIIKKPDSMRDDLHVVFLSHSEDVSANGFTKTKMKTIGKMLDDKITLEGLFTVVLQAQARVVGKDQMEYNFITISDGTTTVKSPMGMFPEKYIDNDLKYVLDCIDKYNSEE